MDLDVYLSKYRGHRQRLQRAMYIASNAANGSQQQKEATRRALALFQDSFNVTAYTEFCSSMFQRGCDVHLEEGFVAARNAAFSDLLSAKQQKLGQAQAVSAKDLSREALFELAELYASRGDMNHSNKCLHRAQEHCKADEHEVQLTHMAIQCAILTPSATPMISKRLEKTLQTGGAATTDAEYGYLIVADAMLKLEGARRSADSSGYKLVAITLSQKLRRSREIPSDFSLIGDFSCAGDVLLIAVLCALATMDRKELEQLVMMPEIKSLLDDEPIVKDLLLSFYDCKYSASFEAMEKLHPRIFFDVFLGTHASHLTKAMRQNALRQYASPYVTLSLDKMSAAFQCTRPNLELELRQLIQLGKIQARMDLAAGVLKATRTNRKEIAAIKMLTAATKLEQDTLSVARLLSLQRNHVMERLQVLHRTVAAASSSSHR